MYYLRNSNCRGYYYMQTTDQQRSKMSFFFQIFTKGVLKIIYLIYKEYIKFNSVILRCDFTHSTANPKLFSFVCISYLPYTFALFNAILIIGLPIAIWQPNSYFKSPIQFCRNCWKSTITNVICKSFACYQMSPNSRFLHSFELPSSSRWINVILSIQPILLI